LIQEPFSIGALSSQECFWWEPFYRSLLSRNLLPGTFWYRERFSQELYLQERIGGNYLAGTFWQERYVLSLAIGINLLTHLPKTNLKSRNFDEYMTQPSIQYVTFLITTAVVIIVFLNCHTTDHL
jgi:hypothetical protein